VTFQATTLPPAEPSWLELPDGWERVPEPPADAVLQAFAPADGGFRASVTVAATPRGVDEPAADWLARAHQTQFDSLASVMTDPLLIDHDPATTVAGCPAARSTTAFRFGTWTLTSCVWTVATPDEAITIACLGDADQFVVDYATFEQIVDSLPPRAATHA
jgi:hypothetical protein